ncbi:hypothetical protein ASD45_07450 [Pseudolabrys sp. Root1462]|jgi:hypothetical protein|nr:hypothetical protein ASD45_07450 [Pseudolabrys sp. Root1462]
MTRFALRSPPAHKRKPFRVSDIVALGIGAALLIAALAALLFIVPKFRPAEPVPTPAEIAARIRIENAEARLAYRQGSILVVDPDSCTDYAFDNWSGSVRYQSVVDCDERLAKMQKAQTERSTERMRTVIEGFRR